MPGNIRLDALHKLTHRLTREFGAIGIESLNVAGMVRNRNLSRAVSDMGFYEFKRQLLYKASWRGVEIVEADRFYPSSKTCSACGLVADSLPLKIRVWTCPCGAHHDRDVNAAINLKNMAVGFTATACGDSSSGGGPVGTVKLPSAKQESTNNRKGV
jgi:putative transposase